MKKKSPSTPVTLQDVSQAAGVSVATVSRVLSGRGGVMTEKADRVREAVASVGYTPQRRTRPRPFRGADPVALLRFSDDALARYSNDLAQTIFGVAGALLAEGVPMLYADLSGGQPLPEEVRAGRVQGLLLAGGDAAGRPKGLPEVPSFWITSHRDGPGEDAALAGNDHVGRLAADYLLGRGCERLACLDLLAGNPADAVRARWFAAHAQAGGAASVQRFASPQRLPPGDDPRGFEKLVAGAEAAVDAAAAAEDRPDGLFVTNGLLLGPVYARLRHHGIEPGQDVLLVVSGHHQPLLAALDPPPASIDLRGEVIGRCAVERLLHRIRRPDDSLPVDLVVRAKLVEPGGA